MSRLEVGQRVEYTLSGGKRVLGKLVYGPNNFHVKPNEHDWCGVVLDEPLGKKQWHYSRKTVLPVSRQLWHFRESQ